jgi:hypothetical protein
MCRSLRTNAGGKLILRQVSKGHRGRPLTRAMCWVLPRSRVETSRLILEQGELRISLE